MACAETDTGETPEADTGVTTDASTAATAVEPPARRKKGRIRRRPLKPIAEMDKGLQDGKDSMVPAATESTAGRPTMKKRAPGQMVQADEMRGKYVTTEGVVFHPKVTLALGDSEWVVIYAVPTKRVEQVIKLVNAWVDDMARPARDLAEIKARAERRSQEFRELERALKGDGAGRKRGLFDEGGQLLNWLFGTATTKDLESVHSRLESFDKKGLEVVQHRQEQATLLYVTIGHLAEHEPEIRALMAAAGHVWREQVQLRKVFNDSWTNLARELLFLQKVFEFNYALQFYSVFPMPVATSKEESVSHSYAGLAPYLGVSPDRQLFVEFNVDEVRKCASYMGGVCPFLKPINRKGRMKSCAAAVFLQEQEGIQRNCHLDSKKLNGIDLFYIGGRKWGYAGKDNVTIVLQCPGKRIGGIGLPQVLPAAGMMPVKVTSVIDEEVVGILSGLLAPVVEQSQPVAKSPIMEEAPAALRTPTRIDLAGTSSHLKAVERLQRQWEEEENAKRYPFEWLIGCLFPLPMLVYLWIEYRRLNSHVDTLLLAR
ncbi:Uncharacterized protein APZ42_025150, partial [Daphnia magna]